MELQIFNNAQFGSVRTTVIDGDVVFVGKDVAEALGYNNPRDAISRHVDVEDKGVAKCDTLGGSQDLTVINESGLYSLVFASRLPKAREFKHWVTSEVLPTIRRHGVYAIDEVLANPDILINALQELKKEREQKLSLQKEVLIKSQQIAELQPKASYYDVVLNCKDLVAISVIAKDYGWTANHMNQYLHEKGIQFKQGKKIWLLYKEYAEMGLTSTKTHTYSGNDGNAHSRPHTYWTQKGRLFIYDLLKEEGILPLIEQED